MNILNAIKVYAEGWKVSASRDFTQEELEGVSEAYTVDSQYGTSVCLVLKSGGKGFIPLDRDSAVGAGVSVDLSKAKLLTLSRSGEADIYRVSI